jgi:hypothetical protein
MAGPSLRRRAMLRFGAGAALLASPAVRAQPA